MPCPCRDEAVRREAEKLEMTPTEMKLNSDLLKKINNGEKPHAPQISGMFPAEISSNRLACRTPVLSCNVCMALFATASMKQGFSATRSI